MDANSIRRAFTDFFVERDHRRYPSSPLVPPDPTLLFTSAGMVQFKAYLMGDEAPPHPRATSIQKCFRAVDIENIGVTDRHLTFFEMMGNFSFGDYFKERAIPLAHEFVTENLKIDPERLWYTVYETDDEAAEIWLDAVGIPEDRLQRGGEDNFWQMGIPGPCGPSSEIFVDRGEEYGEAGGPIGGNEDRFVEIWNLVFMQNIQDEPYHVVGDLPAKNIDTGSGLERVALVLQDAASIFETDVIRPILTAAERATSVTYGADERTDASLRIMADHGKGLTFLIGDGVAPSNEGRGYVLRRLLRRVVRHAWALGVEDHVVPALVNATVDEMQQAYPELAARRDHILELAEKEEFGFRRTLETGSAQLENELSQVPDGGALAGDVAFRLHDTYGFPIELTEEIAAEHGAGLDRAGFEQAMQAQRERARASWKGAAAAGEEESYRTLLSGIDPSEFVGYDTTDTRARVLAIVRDGDLVERAGEGEEVELFLDTTPFYAESGGQVGDTGLIESETGSMAVRDTQFALTGYNGHRGVVRSGSLAVGQDVTAGVDDRRREGVTKSHTGTHIVHWALREVLGDHVQQAGSLVQAGRLRFDFSHHAAVAAEEIGDVERLANERVIENWGVHAFETSKEEAQEMGALAFFGDKYGERVRVVEVGRFSRELCGGTHVRTSGQTGPLFITSESSIGSNMRRIEVLSGATAYQQVADTRRALREAARLLNTSPAEVPGSVDALLGRVKAQEQRLAEFAERDRTEAAAGVAKSAEDLPQGLLVAAVVGERAPDDLRMLALQVRDRLDKAVVVLGSTSGGKGSLVAAVSSDLTSVAPAGDILAEAAKVLGGGGSRDPELAQAGGPNGSEIEEAVDRARQAAAERLRA